MLQQATDYTYPAPLEQRWVTRCDRTDIDCLCVSTAIDSPSKVPAIAAAPIWFDARLRSHPNGMFLAGLAGRVWGFSELPARACSPIPPIHFITFPSFSHVSPPIFGKNPGACGRNFTRGCPAQKPRFAQRGYCGQCERMTRALFPIKNRTSGCVSVDRSTWATLSTYNTPTQLDGHSRISRPRYVDAIQRRTL